VPSGTSRKLAGHRSGAAGAQRTSPASGSVTFHRPLVQRASVSHSGTAWTPYSQTIPSSEQGDPGAGARGEQACAASASRYGAASARPASASLALTRGPSDGWAAVPVSPMQPPADRAPHAPAPETSVHARRSVLHPARMFPKCARRDALCQGAYGSPVGRTSRSPGESLAPRSVRATRSRSYKGEGRSRQRPGLRPCHGSRGSPFAPFSGMIGRDLEDYRSSQMREAGAREAGARCEGGLPSAAPVYMAGPPPAALGPMLQNFGKSLGRPLA
jgi:hypothetical protein